MMEWAKQRSQRATVEALITGCAESQNEEQQLVRCSEKTMLARWKGPTLKEWATVEVPQWLPI
jgi:uncharacterized protein (DUF305 family)